MQPYRPRPIEYHGLRPHRGWRLKLYSIVHGSAPLDWAAFDPGLELVLHTLPEPARQEGRPGLGFLIAHRGNGADYVVLGWWERENELPIRLAVRSHDEREWRAPRQNESFCVWDLQVIWHEREAYVATILSGGGEELHDRYLASAPDGSIA